MTTPGRGLDGVLGQYADLYRVIQERMGHGGDLGADSPHQTMNRYFRNGTWSPDRIALHQQILSNARDRNANKPRDGHAVLLTAGAPGAGKSSALRLLDDLHGKPSPLGRDLASAHPIPLADFVTIDPDEFKRGLLLEPDTRPRLPEAALHLTGGHTLAPAEMATLVHAESRHLANQFALWASENGYNLLYDSSLRTLNRTHDLLLRLQSRGYQHRILISVEVPPHDALVGNATRWKDGRHAFDVGTDPYGGRMAPEHYIRDLYPHGPTGDSTSRINARKLATDGVITHTIELDRRRGREPHAEADVPAHRIADTTIHIRTHARDTHSPRANTAGQSVTIDTADRLRDARQRAADTEHASRSLELTSNPTALPSTPDLARPAPPTETAEHLDNHLNLNRDATAEIT